MGIFQTIGKVLHLIDVAADKGCDITEIGFDSVLHLARAGEIHAAYIEDAAVHDVTMKRKTMQAQLESVQIKPVKAA